MQSPNQILLNEAPIKYRINKCSNKENHVGPKNQVGPENQVGLENQVRPKNMVGPGNKAGLGSKAGLPINVCIHAYINIWARE